MSKLLQSYIYSVTGEKEYAGHRHPSGKVFKSTAFRIRYFDSCFEIEVTAFNKGELEISVLWQGDREKKFFYENGPVAVWPARYEIRAKSEMLNL